MYLTKDANNLSYLFLVGVIGYFLCILVINGLYKYYLVGPNEEAVAEMKEEVKLSEISTICNDIVVEKKEDIQALAK